MSGVSQNTIVFHISLSPEIVAVSFRLGMAGTRIVGQSEIADLLKKSGQPGWFPPLPDMFAEGGDSALGKCFAVNLANSIVSKA